MTTTWTREQLLNSGARTWTPAQGEKRFYLDAQTVTDVRIVLDRKRRYIDSATYAGQPISETEAQRIMQTKIWAHADGEIHVETEARTDLMPAIEAWMAGHADKPRICTS